MIKEVNETRNIGREVERELWARAAGRCQFSGCNKILYKSPITQENVNISEKAHIYSFSKNGPRGNSDYKKSSINDISNLMLVCHDCHKTIDQDKKGDKYSVALLSKWKNQHENRIKLVTGICSDKKSIVLLYGAKIGESSQPLQPNTAMEALFPEWNPADENPITLSMSCSHEDNAPNYWETEAAHLKTSFNRKIISRIEESKNIHFSLFAFAPQPLLILLGSLFTDKVPVEVYQLHREPQTWKWQEHNQEINYIIKKPKVIKKKTALVISLSSLIDYKRITSVIGSDVSIWELTLKNPDNCHNDFLKSKLQLSLFRNIIRKLMVDISKYHGIDNTLYIFPAMPIACAIEFGRIRMPKADMRWIIYDQNIKARKFIKAIKIGDESK